MVSTAPTPSMATEAKRTEAPPRKGRGDPSEPTQRQRDRPPGRTPASDPADPRRHAPGPDDLRRQGPGGRVSPDPRVAPSGGCPERFGDLARRCGVRGVERVRGAVRDAGGGAAEIGRAHV